MSLKTGIYRHFKGNRYQLIDIAKHSESGEAFAVYRALYGEQGLWIRPIDMFDETLQRNGKTFKRFEYQDEAI